MPKVLVVDDDYDMLTLVRAALEKFFSVLL